MARLYEAARMGGTFAFRLSPQRGRGLDMRSQMASGGRSAFSITPCYGSQHGRSSPGRIRRRGTRLCRGTRLGHDRRDRGDAPSLVSDIHHAVPRVPDRDVRAYLLLVKRGVHTGVDVLPRPSPGIETRLRAAEPEIAVAVEEEIERRLELAGRRRSFDALFDAELDRQRRELRRVTTTAPFRRALEIGNPQLAMRWKPTGERSRCPAGPGCAAWRQASSTPS